MRHLQLAPGLRVVRRGRDLLQVGTLAGRRAVLPRTREVEQLLDDLLRREPFVGEPDGLRELTRRGCVVPATDREDLSPVATRVVGALPPLDHAALLDGWGVCPGDPGDPVLLLGVGEVDRRVLDPLVRAGVPHLVVRLLDAGAVLGPFVVPGETACVRCVDAHLTLDDPEHPAVTERYVRATARPRTDGVRDVADPALAVLALAWAARDLRAHTEGRSPSTWSRTWQLGPEPSELSSRSWLRHPLCGCAWPQHGPPAGTMEA